METTPVFSPLCNSLIDLTYNVQIHNYIYTFSITTMLIIIIDLLVYNNYHFYYIQEYIHLQLSMNILAWNLNWMVKKGNTFLKYLTSSTSCELGDQIGQDQIRVPLCCRIEPSSTLQY